MLSDPKRRKLYNELGSSGLKLVESPTEVNHTELLKNFQVLLDFTLLLNDFHAESLASFLQKNHKDRTSVVLLIAFIFAAVLILPILFSLKCDGTLGDEAPWTAIWVPMWIVDFFVLLSAMYLMFDQPDPPAPVEEGDPAPPPQEALAMSVKISNLLTSVCFVLIQIFVLMRMDKYIHWSWFAVFAPWFAYEAVHVVALVNTAFLTTISPPDFENLTLIIEEGQSGEEEMFMRKMALEHAYFEKIIEQKTAQKTILICLLRAWQAVFLALKLNGDRDWNWGLVLLPIWVYLFAQYVYSFVYRLWGLSKLKGLDVEAIAAGTETDPLSMVKMQQGNELLSSSFFGCLFQAVPLFMAVMLVCRLQTSDYSTFLIILPVFLFLGCCCCLVFCGICCMSVLDMDGLNEEMEKQSREAATGASGETGGEKEYMPPQPSAVAAGDIEGGTNTANPAAAYGTFQSTTFSAAAVVVVAPPPEESSQSPMVQPMTPPAPKPVTHVDADID